MMAMSSAIAAWDWIWVYLVDTISTCSLKFKAWLSLLEWYGHGALLYCLVFQTSLTCAAFRWLKNPLLDISSVPPVTFNEGVDRSSTFVELPLSAQSNPLQAMICNPTHKTAAVPPRLAFHEAHAALRPILAGIQTEDDLDELVDWLNEIRYDFFFLFRATTLTFCLQKWRWWDST